MLAKNLNVISYIYVDVKKDEVLTLFSEVEQITEIAFAGDSNVCKSKECVRNVCTGRITRRILTKDDYLVLGYKCKRCKDTTFYLINKVDYEEENKPPLSV